MSRAARAHRRAPERAKVQAAARDLARGFVKDAESFRQLMIEGAEAGAAVCDRLRVATLLSALSGKHGPGDVEAPRAQAERLFAQLERRDG